MVFYREGIRDAVLNPQQLTNKRHGSRVKRKAVRTEMPAQRYDTKPRFVVVVFLKI